MPCSRRMYLLDRQQMWSDELCLGINCALAGDISLALNYPSALSESRQAVASSATEHAADPDAACKAAAGSGVGRRDPAREQRVRIVRNHGCRLPSVGRHSLGLWMLPRYCADITAPKRILPHSPSSEPETASAILARRPERRQMRSARRPSPKAALAKD